MTAFLSPLFGAGWQAFTNTGVVLSGGKIHTYVAGSVNTPQATWTTSTQTTQNSNPIILDSAGRPPNEVWLSSSAYKIVLTDSLDNVLGSWDFVSGVNNVSSTQTEWLSSGLTPTYVSPTQFTVSGNQTSVLMVNRRIQYKLGSGIFYGYISASVFDGVSTTTVTVVADSTSLDNSLFEINYSFLSAVNLSIPENVINGTAQKPFLDTIYVGLSGNQTVAGIKNFSSSPTIPNATSSTQACAYGQAGDAAIAETHATTEKTTPVDADEFPLADSAATFALKKTTWADIKSTLSGVFAALAGSASQVFSVGNATAASNAVRADQIQTQSVTAFTTGGTSTAYTLTPTPALASLSNYHRFNVVFHTNPGTSPTLAISGLTPKNLMVYNNSGSKVAVTSAVLVTGMLVDVEYDGTDYVILNPLPSIAVGGGVSPFNFISGFTLSSISGTSTTATFTISAGQGTALQGSATPQTTSVIKLTSTSWAIANGNAINGSDAPSSTLASSTTYYVYMISGASGTGSYVSNSLTPTFPAGYAVSARRVGWFNTDGSGSPISGTEMEISGGAVLRWHTTQTLDVAVTNLGTSRTLYALNAPLGIKTQVLIRATEGNAGSSQGLILTSGDETDIAPQVSFTWSSAPGYDLLSAADASTQTPMLITNTSKQIGARANATSTNLYIVTRGVIDFRRS